VTGATHRSMSGSDESQYWGHTQSQTIVTIGYISSLTCRGTLTAVGELVLIGRNVTEPYGVNVAYRIFRRQCIIGCDRYELRKDSHSMT
jgi:hypothetical protein